MKMLIGHGSHHLTGQGMLVGIALSKRQIENLTKAIARSNLLKIMESKLSIIKEIVLLFLGGASAGLIVFMLFGGVWQVNHFWWVMTATTVACGLIAVMFRRNFENMLSALLDNSPWL